MKLYLSLRSHAVAATVLLLQQFSEVILQSLGSQAHRSFVINCHLLSVIVFP